MLLAIDTSTKTASVALWNGGAVVGDLSWQSGRNHTTQTLPAIDYLLERTKKGRDGLRAVAVAVGPGSFSGLRVGISLAKGLCLAMGLPIVGVGTLEAIGYPHRQLKLPVCAVIDAGRGEVCAAMYSTDGEHPRLVEGPQVMSIEELVQRIEGPTLICGEIEAHQRDIIVSRLGEQAIVTTPALSLPRASCIAELAWQRLKRGDADDLAELQPIYVRRPSTSFQPLSGDRSR